MRNIVFIILILFSTNAFADYKWKRIGKNVDGDVNYVDLLSIKRVGNNVFFFRLMDYIKPTEYGDLSSKIYFEVNCLDLSFRYIKDFYYQEPMGNGKYTVNDKTGEWKENIKDSIGEAAREFVCNFK